MELTIKGLPIPPSNNHRLMPSRGRLIKSPEFRLYDHKIDLWILRNRRLVEDAREKTERWLKSGLLFYVEMDFYFSHEKLMTKKGEPKRIDIDSREKVVQDSLAKIIGQDDKCIIEKLTKKILNQSSDEYVNLRITPIRWLQMKPLIA